MDDIDRYLQEDLGTAGDITSDSLFTDEIAYAYIVSKEKCVVAGLEEAKNVFERVGATATLMVNDGDLIEKNTAVAYINGSIRSILRGERLALNFICRMSGIASETKRLIDICRTVNPQVIIAATRKTTPGFRKYEKKAVILGGGDPHRYGLYDAVMIKDNHIRFIGSVEDAIKRVKKKIKNKIIEVEVENKEDAIAAAKLDVDVIMLDNFDAKSGRLTAKKIRQINPHIVIEVSGGITPENIIEYASFADRISLGYLTHSIKSKDFSLEIQVPR
ncbi:nicotinate-nucleotide diphosphorylase (carboxylating) [Euryarchaeota archaeon ex4484_162]|nr:MAG: nicotinate-nucleotide diphosphorylase (carboxylating) [Euryarchaeota archaeon ex4484_162]RLF29635.1 MAG: carboxylating nicotinate-nucleotide diphosphorylase [Thermoplasmata archaeon]RLF35047.1 MAG: carboxylating nicotinate-nucleotide diphosphorylase [Thermoplasmata archaeon]